MYKHMGTEKHAPDHTVGHRINQKEIKNILGIEQIQQHNITKLTGYRKEFKKEVWRK